jgi:hypothetical protein
MDMAGKSGGKKTHGRVVRRAAWRTDRSFRVPRPRARGTRGRTACRWPGRRTGPPAAHLSDDWTPYCRGIAVRMRNGSIGGLIAAIFPGNIRTSPRFLPSAPCMYRREYRLSRKNHAGGIDPRKPRSAQKHPLSRHLLVSDFTQYRTLPPRLAHNTLICMINLQISGDPPEYATRYPGRTRMTPIR